MAAQVMIYAQRHSYGDGDLIVDCNLWLWGARLRTSDDICAFLISGHGAGDSGKLPDTH